MNVYYNQKGIGDVLMLPLKTADRYEKSFKRIEDVVEIFNTTSGEVIGYNIFNASKYITLADGQHKLDEAFLKKLNDILEENGYKERLELDLSPKFVVGYVKEIRKHENADKLNVCQVDLGDESVQIVCGAPNVDKGQHVVVAKVGAIMPSGMEIKDANLRGEDSFGMICSQRELGLPNAPEEKGIYVLEANVKAGDEFTF
ncbi:putative tRNA-binding protein YtpR [Halolactibacillus alkaliphilus]|uniref:Putative tRNA-binding protein YtpR n=1 Tax=Halolactibacillus alkaliphilus TaxID=442899 RepID=A0A511X2X8_9BACI|nr:DUF4479 family protein [Halolactibacillus alkaliphilus]GEN57297.1 putative tRNA-binding protein YtpR [Halolactibacillus alkaliphilus]GGN72400.1 putative tRNA-binding protein YtpR [Halolactibacillus alkaliphilus]SFO89453.1 tRNA-binding protein [Halolactibacillus alkaliphilus]